MVTVKRRGGGEYEPLPYAQTPERAGGSLFGLRVPNRNGERASPTKLFYSNTTSLSSSTAFYPKCSQSDRGESNGWFVKIVYAAAAFSWLATHAFSSGQALVLATASKDALAIKNGMDHLSESVAYIESQVVDERRLLSQLKKAGGALQHEIKVVTAVEATTGARIKPAPRSGNEHLIKGWLTHRKDSLLTKIYQLQRYLQASSRLSVIEHFGEQPRRVEITIELTKVAGEKSVKSFIVETAPLDLVPISINLFLDMVSAGIWDNTMFLHHQEVEHVIAAAPLDANTQQVKHNEISNLGWMELGFPEYSDRFPHQKYTLGFAAQGPTFYINTFDNSVDHGPGGQLHHTLPTDADPCFAKVVEGFDVVDELVSLGLKYKSTTNEGNHPWVDASHSWTRIVSAKLLKS